METNFKGKRALITGAGKGIGRCCVKTLVKCGAKVVALSRTQADLDSLKKECPNIDIICVDLKDWAKTRKAVEGALPIDLLVNNAALIKTDGGLLTITEEGVDEMMSSNLKSIINISQVVAKDMIKRKVAGSIVNISAFLSTRVADLGLDTYAISKGALDTLTRIAATEFGAHGIRVNSIHPILTKTKLVLDNFINGPPAAQKKVGVVKDRIPLNRFAEEQDVVDQVVHFLSDKSKMVNGQFLYVDGGYTTS